MAGLHWPISFPEQASLLGQLAFPPLPLRFSWQRLVLFLLPSIPLFPFLPGKILIFKACFNVILTSLPSPVRINCSLLCVAQQHLSRQRTVVTCFTTQPGGRDGRGPVWPTHLLISVSGAQGMASKCLLKPIGIGAGGMWSLSLQTSLGRDLASPFLPAVCLTSFSLAGQNRISGTM